MNGFEVKFLKELSRLKGWQYHPKIEQEKRIELLAFVTLYILQEPANPFNTARLRYSRLNYLVNNAQFANNFKAIYGLMERSADENEFILKYQKVTASLNH